MLKRVLLVALSALTAASALAQDQAITLNYKDAEIGTVIEAVQRVTGKTIIPDPRVRANVTMLSTSPMSPDAFYEAFLAILAVHGFAAVPAGNNIIKIIPDATARQLPGNDLPDRVSSASDEFVTQVITVKNVSAAQLVPILRPLVSTSAGHMAAYPASNMLIITDRANNVNRMIRIIRRLDQGGDEEVDVIALEHASAAEIVRVANQLFPAAAAAAEGGAPVKLVADERTNSVLISGEKSQRLRLRTLVTHLDTPLESGGDTQVRYLNYADAEKIAAKLKEQATASAAATGAAPAAAGAAAAQIDRSVTIWAEPETNALVITAPPKIMRSLMDVIDKLDIRRLQVAVEAIIVDMSTTKAAELGVNWVVDGSDDNFAVGGFISPIGASGTTIVDIARAVDNPTGVTTIPRGVVIGGGRVQDTGTNFAAILKALRSDTDSNIIATPQIITMDNQEAQIKDAREVPFVTGQYTTSASGGDGNVNPFQTIQRQEVGTILKITPQINEGDSVLLKIEQESSDIAENRAGAVDVVTIKRTISTSVLVEDGAILVLGGLIRDRAISGEDRVPFLGRIPLLGELFKVRNSTKEKTSLMVFIKPTILRNENDTAIATNAKYEVIRNQQQKMKRGKVPLVPFEKQPMLPPLDEKQQQRGQQPRTNPRAVETEPLPQPDSPAENKPAEDAAPEQTPPPQ